MTDVPPEQRWRRGDRLRVAWTRIRLVGANQDTLTVVYDGSRDQGDRVTWCDQVSPGGAGIMTPRTGSYAPLPTKTC
jgi:hypothetical protein